MSADGANNYMLRELNIFATFLAYVNFLCLSDVKMRHAVSRSTIYDFSSILYPSGISKIAFSAIFSPLLIPILAGCMTQKADITFVDKVGSGRYNKIKTGRQGYE